MGNQRDFLRQVIDINPHLIFVKDREGRFTLVNQAVAAAYGTTVEDLLGKTDSDFSASDEQVEAFRRDDLHVMDSLEEKVIPFETLTDAEGNVRSLQTIKRPLVDDDGVARHVLGVATDISELMRVNDERRRLERQILHAQKLESLGVLAGGIAHDFNNLLVGILANADLAARSLGAEGPERKSVERIRTAARRAADLCRQILAYSGRGHFVIEPVDLSEVVHEMADLLETSVSKSVRLETELPAALPDVEADATQLRQVILNLITNASDAAAETGGTVRLTAGTSRLDAAALASNQTNETIPEGEYVTIEVSDDGAGMDEDTIEKIFDPFFSTKLSGRGLGLAAVLGIVRGHKGALFVDSTPGEGTTFSLHFPPATRRRREDTPVAPAPAIRAARGRILVVDDERLVLGAVRDALEIEGIEVETAADGDEGLEKFRRAGDDLLGVLLDMTMPPRGGAEILREMRRLRPRVPIVMMSGYDQSEASQQLAGARPTGFLHKPFEIDDLLAAVDLMSKKSV